jgi:hypothetical protein
VVDGVAGLLGGAVGVGVVAFLDIGVVGVGGFFGCSLAGIGGGVGVCFRSDGDIVDDRCELKKNDGHAPAPALWPSPSRRLVSTPHWPLAGSFSKTGDHPSPLASVRGPLPWCSARRTSGGVALRAVSSFLWPLVGSYSKTGDHSTSLPGVGGLSPWCCARRKIEGAALAGRRWSLCLLCCVTSSG